MANIYSIHIFSFLGLYLNIIVYHIHNSNCLTQAYFPLQFLEDKQKRHTKSSQVTKHPVCINVQHIYALSRDIYETMFIVLTIYEKQDKYVKLLRRAQFKHQSTSNVFQFQALILFNQRYRRRTISYKGLQHFPGIVQSWVVQIQNR